MVAQFGLALVALSGAGRRSLAGIGQGSQADSLALRPVNGLPEFLAEGVEAIEAIGDELAEQIEGGAIGLDSGGRVSGTGIEERPELICEG